MKIKYKYKAPFLKINHEYIKPFCFKIKIYIFHRKDMSDLKRLNPSAHSQAIIYNRWESLFKFFTHSHNTSDFISKNLNNKLLGVNID